MQSIDKTLPTSIIGELGGRKRPIPAVMVEGGQAMSGPTGEYTIETDGMQPGWEYAFRYKDSKYEFYFYVETKPHIPRQGMLTLVVHDASMQRFAGGDPVIDPGDKSAIEKNIQHYLTTVKYQATPPNPVPTVTFTWRLGQ
jgi:hypothetical protein